VAGWYGGHLLDGQLAAFQGRLRDKALSFHFTAHPELSKWDICLLTCIERGDILVTWSQHKVFAMFKAVELEWIAFLEESEHSPAVAASSSGVPSCVTCVTNRAEEVDFARSQWLVRLFLRCARVSLSSLQRARPWRQAELAGGQGGKGGDGNFPGEGY